MSLYINGIEYDIRSPDGFFLEMDINPYYIVTNGLKLISSDNYILKDINGVYLTVEKETN